MSDSVLHISKLSFYDSIKAVLQLTKNHYAAVRMGIHWIYVIDRPVTKC